MTTPFIGEIEVFAFDFPPRGWAQCAGQLLPIQQNQALFALLGTTYGGNGTTNFALPDLRGRISISFNGSYPLGARVGTENVTLPPNGGTTHTHTVNAQNTGTSGGRPLPTNTSFPGSPHIGTNAVTGYSSATPSVAMAPTSPDGGNQPHANLMPYLAMGYCIALQGIFPSRN